MKKKAQGRELLLTDKDKALAFFQKQTLA